jgi:hypothetical protein
MQLLPQLLAQAEYAPIRRFLVQDADLRKRFQFAERLADLFDQYQVYRADWLAAWAQGGAVLIDARAARTPIPEGQRWQASLWRALLADVEGGPGHLGRGSHAGRAAVHAAFLRRVADWPADQRPAGLPRRLMVFGISSLPRQSFSISPTAPTINKRVRWRATPTWRVSIRGLMRSAPAMSSPLGRGAAATALSGDTHQARSRAIGWSPRLQPWSCQSKAEALDSRPEVAAVRASGLAGGAVAGIAIKVA